MTRKIHKRSKVSRTESTNEPRQPSLLEKKRNTHAGCPTGRRPTRGVSGVSDSTTLFHMLAQTGLELLAAVHDRRNREHPAARGGRSPARPWRRARLRLTPGTTASHRCRRRLSCLGVVGSGADDQLAARGEALRTLELAELLFDLRPRGRSFRIRDVGEHLGKRTERLTLESDALGRGREVQRGRDDLGLDGTKPCGVPEVGPGPLTSDDRWLGMIPTCRCGCCT